MLEEIGELADLLILVDLESKSNEDIEILEKEAQISVKKVMCKSSLKEALNYIIPMARPDDLILVSGSLQLIKEFYILKEMDELSYD